MTTKRRDNVKKATKAKAQEYVIVRCRDAGVHAGYLVRLGKERVELCDSRRIWYWSGAASLSEIAVYGLNPAKGSASKIAAVVPKILLRASDVAEVISCLPAGRASVEGSPVWRA